MERDDILLDPKWISSFYALVATAVCTLIFTYKGINFFDAFVKTFFTVVSFYLFGLITAAAVNFYYMNFIKVEEISEEPENDEEQPEEGTVGEETQEEGSEQTV